MHVTGGLTKIGQKREASLLISETSLQSKPGGLLLSLGGFAVRLGLFGAIRGRAFRLIVGVRLTATTDSRADLLHDRRYGLPDCIHRGRNAASHVLDGGGYSFFSTLHRWADPFADLGGHLFRP